MRTCVRFNRWLVNENSFIMPKEKVKTMALTYTTTLRAYLSEETHLEEKRLGLMKVGKVFLAIIKREAAEDLRNEFGGVIFLRFLGWVENDVERN
jgi:hypothetical protein